jgi:hypothetical protein
MMSGARLYLRGSIVQISRLFRPWGQRKSRLVQSFLALTHRHCRETIDLPKLKPRRERPISS